MALIDPRVTKQAEVLVNYSARVKKGERVYIHFDLPALPLVKEIYRLAIKKGAAEVILHYASSELAQVYFKNSTKKQRELFPQIEMDITKKVDCWFGIKSSSNLRALSSVDAKAISERSKIMRKITNWRVNKTRWVLTEFPTSAQAQEADMSLADYEDFVFNAINKVDWKKVHKKQETLRRLMDKTKTVRIRGKGTDLTLSIKGRKAINSAGRNNMPSGEVFTSAVESSAEGIITYNYPAINFGRQFTNVSLTFEKGKVVKATADKNEKDLNKVLDMDRGARYIGELGIGNNFKITRFTKNILFDEKIGGSMHIALGNGYKETLSKNTSSLHWDMIKDLREGGELFFDDKLVQRNGKWLIKL